MYWHCLSVLFFSVLLLRTTDAQICPKEENANCSSCFCDYGKSLNGWSYTCIDSNLFEILYTVQYVENQSLTFECGAQEPHYQAIFHQFELDGVQTFAFKSCPLPNVSFSEIIPYRKEYPVEQIIVEDKRDNRSLTTALFQDLSSSLKSLILRGNRIDMLPANLLSNFTLLKYLSISDNNLSPLPKGIFSDMVNLLILEIPSNFLESLPEGIFQNLRLLEKLYLHKNKLKELPDGVFTNLSNLKVLDLADNHLMVLPDGVFHGLENMVQVRLRANVLMTLSKDLFNGSLNLKDVDLSLNRFIQPLPEELLYGLKQLENVTIGNCNLSKIHENFFSQCPNIRSVNLKRNSLTSLPQNVFLKNSLLRDINLSFNYLQALPADLFPNQIHLEILSIAQNNLSVIPNRLFKRARKIKTLLLDGNRLRNANQTIFCDLPNLELLDLSVNNLTHFELDTNEFIKHVNLSYNSFTKMPSIKWTRHPRIEELNLKQNIIGYLSIPLLHPTNNRSFILNLAHNNIKTVNVTYVSFNDSIVEELSSKDNDSLANESSSKDNNSIVKELSLPSKDNDSSAKELSFKHNENYIETRILLNNNPLVCDCQIYNFYEYVKYNRALPKPPTRFDAVQNLICYGPSNLAGQQIMSLLLDQFTCELKEKCSIPCRCYTRAQDNANIVNCSYHNLKILPSQIPDNTSILLFQNNSLSNTEGFNSKMWENLTEINLDNNRILRLDEWDIPSKLTNISLVGNHIRHLPSSLMAHVSNARRFQIALGNNPWSCNCTAIGFKKWLVQHSPFIKDVEKVICANRLRLNGKLVRLPILTAPDAIICPTDNWPYALRLIIVTLTCAVIAFLFLFVSIFYYHHKEVVMSYVYAYTHYVYTCFYKRQEMDEDRLFDAFVSCDRSDCDVALKLVEELENNRSFRLCTHERNWIAGCEISWNIFNSVHSSKKTILVISKEFLLSMWFEAEFHVAYFQMLEDEIDRLIVIIKGELPFEETMDRNLQHVLSTKNCLVWGEKWFWEKLTSAMPHKRQRILQPAQS